MPAMPFIIMTEAVEGEFDGGSMAKYTENTCTVMFMDRKGKSIIEQKVQASCEHHTT